jgi:hypothetical protein
MENIFTLHKYEDDEDDDVPQSMNIDDLYDKKRGRDTAQLKIFNRMLKRIHVKITVTSRQRTSEKICWFVVPEIMLGIPMYDQGMCIAYVMDKLCDDGFRSKYIHPNTLMISWNHWVPNYVIREIKEKTGKVYDNQGNDLTPYDGSGGGGALQIGSAPERGNSAMGGMSGMGGMGGMGGPSNSATIVYSADANTFQRPKKGTSTKKYTPIDEYKPRGSMVYDQEMLFDSTSRMK